MYKNNKAKQLLNMAVIITLLLSVFACSAPMSKESYLKKYETFIADIVQNAKSYDDKDWSKKTETYKKFTGEWYDKFKDGFTVKDQIVLTGYKVKFNYYSTLNQAASTVKVLLETLNADEIREMIQYYMDNNMHEDLQKFYNEAKKLGGEMEFTVSRILKELKK